jgi:hypothetical protein
MTHMSYSDVPRLSAFGNGAKEEDATRCLKDLSGVVVSFFARTFLSHSQSGDDLQSSRYPAIAVRTYGPPLSKSCTAQRTVWE